MTIRSVNTLQISFFENPGTDFEKVLRQRVERLESASGCLTYTLSRSQRDAALWLIAGYWESEHQMTLSFNSVEMTRFINYLVEVGANLNFASFAPEVDLDNDD
jgi:quinol monooxygenase YgiN